MKKFERMKELENELNNIEVPTELLQRMEQAKMDAEIERSKRRSNEMKLKKMKRIRYSTIAASIAVAVFTCSVNLSPAFAQSMHKVPVLGSIVKVITIDKISEHNKYLDAEIDVAGIKGNEEANKILRAEADKAYQLAKDKSEFVKKAVERTGEKEFIPANVTQNYDVISCNNGILSVKITTLEIEASGYETTKGINIDLVSNKVISLKDIFKDNSNYVQVISQDILKQMKAQMAQDSNVQYFITDEDMEPFKQIKADQDFLFDKNGNLMISFDEYEVAPGYMGTVDFTIAKDTIQNILK